MILGGRQRSTICPNLRVLGLQVSGANAAKREKITRQPKRIMMGARSPANHKLERCCLWWDACDWADEPSVVSVMSCKRVVVE